MGFGNALPTVGELIFSVGSDFIVPSATRKLKKERAAAGAPGKEKPGEGGKGSEPGEVTLQDFARMDIRSGCVRKAEAVPKSKKLLKLLVDIGEETPRQVVEILQYVTRG